jgi:MFS family permease
VARGGATEQAARTSFRDVFAVAEFRALWIAQLLSVVGDQLARVALTVLVYDRTRSALLAAITFVVSIVPTFIGGVTLAWLADKYPRRAVMIASDIARGMLVVVMAIPGVPLAVLVVLLFVVTLAGAPFLAARAAIYPDVLTGDRYVMGIAVSLTTFQFAQVIGFAAGGVLVGFFGIRVSLLADAATFLTSAFIVRAWIRPRPAPAGVMSSDRWRPARLRRSGTAYTDAVRLAGRVLQRSGGSRYPARGSSRGWRDHRRSDPCGAGPGASRRRDHVQPFRRPRGTAEVHGAAGGRHLRCARLVCLAS